MSDLPIVWITKLVYVTTLANWFRLVTIFFFFYDTFSLEHTRNIWEFSFISNNRLCLFSFWIYPRLFSLEPIFTSIMSQVEFKVQLGSSRVKSSHPLLNQMIHIVCVPQTIKVHVRKRLRTLSTHPTLWLGVKWILKVCVLCC